MEFELPKDFLELFESLNENGVRYLLVGGYAVSQHGYSRATHDLDIFVANDVANAQNLVRSLAEFGFGTPQLDPKLFTNENSMVVMGVEPQLVEFMNSITGVSFDAAYENRKTVYPEGVRVEVIGIDDLIKNKKSTGRLKDLVDAAALEECN